jgi:hypothetical protein
MRSGLAVLMISSALLVATTARAENDPGRLQQLVAPLTLYPARVAADMLEASANPTQVTQAAAWVQMNPDYEQQSSLDALLHLPAWDPSVTALIRYPAVLRYMDQNLAWTMALGDAYRQEPAQLIAALHSAQPRPSTALAR